MFGNSSINKISSQLEMQQLELKTALFIRYNLIQLSIEALKNFESQSSFYTQDKTITLSNGIVIMDNKSRYPNLERILSQSDEAFINTVTSNFKLANLLNAEGIEQPRLMEKLMRMNRFENPRILLLHIICSGHKFDIQGNCVQDIIHILCTNEGCNLVNLILKSNFGGDLSRVLVQLKQILEFDNQSQSLTTPKTNLQIIMRNNPELDNDKRDYLRNLEENNFHQNSVHPTQVEYMFDFFRIVIVALGLTQTHRVTLVGYKRDQNDPPTSVIVKIERK
jgi:hypothetical protein